MHRNAVETCRQQRDNNGIGENDKRGKGQRNLRLFDFGSIEHVGPQKKHDGLTHSPEQLLPAKPQDRHSP